MAVAEYPARPVDVEDYRERARGPLRAQDPNRDLTGRAAGDDRVLDLHIGLLDVAVLNLVDGLAALDRSEVEQVRGVRGGRCELLGGTFENDRVGVGGGVAHRTLLLVSCWRTKAWPNPGRRAVEK